MVLNFLVLWGYDTVSLQDITCRQVCGRSVKSGGLPLAPPRQVGWLFSSFPSAVRALLHISSFRAPDSELSAPKSNSTSCKLPSTDWQALTHSSNPCTTWHVPLGKMDLFDWSFWSWVCYISYVSTCSLALLVELSSSNIEHLRYCMWCWHHWKTSSRHWFQQELQYNLCLWSGDKAR